MKKNLLFVIDSLACAGAERSLVTLLNLIDTAKYNIDLQLFTYGGEFERFLPKNVNLLPPLPYTEFVSKSIMDNFLHLGRKHTFQWLFSRLRFSLLLRLGNSDIHPYIAMKYWDVIGSCIDQTPKQYDCAIAYAQGVPSLYVIDKVQANKKIAWVNATLDFNDCLKKYYFEYYARFDKIVGVSDSVYNIFSSIYPTLRAKLAVIWDIQDYRIISKLSNLNTGFSDLYEGLRILTVGRLCKGHKGFDLALEACKILKQRGVKFKWYVIGKGSYEEEMRMFIKNNSLEEFFILLGTTSNPYPYFKEAYLYVQTSRHEGYGLTIAEARMLNTPVVTTEFDAVYNQMIQGKNGLVVPQNPEKIADAIELLLNDSELYNSIVSFQKQEKKGNTEEVEKFYKLIES